MADLTPNIVAVWHLNEASGTAAHDASPNNNQGTLINMEDGDWVVGKLNNCLLFDGANEYVEFGNIAGFERTDSFSIEAWIKSSASAAQVILSKMHSYRGWMFYIQVPNGKLGVILANSLSNRILVESSIKINDDSWNHIIVTYDGSSNANGVDIYINGVLDVGTNIIDNTLSATIISTDTCKIARRYTSSPLPFDGNLDEVVIYDKELSQEEVTFRWNGGAGTEEMSEESSPPTAPNEFESFDPRKAYRTKLSSMWNVNKDCDDLEYCIYITDSKGDKVYIPMYLSEEVKSEQLPDLPFLELEIPPGHTTYEPQDIAASTRKMESYILIHIYFTDTDNIDRTEFAKKIKDRLHNLTRYYQSTTDGIVFMNIQDDGLEEETDSAHRVVFHYIATLYVLYYDTCVEP